MNNIFGTPCSEEQVFPIRPRPRRERQSHYRAHIASICYPEISHGLIKTGPYDMPVIRPNNVIPMVADTTPFDRITSKSSNRESIVIFYINDDRFANRLTHPWDYTSVLQQYEGVIAPDLSMYIDMDYPERLSNNYWNKVLTHIGKTGVSISTQIYRGVFPTAMSTALQVVLADQLLPSTAWEY